MAAAEWLVCGKQQVKLKAKRKKHFKILDVAIHPET